MEKIEFDMKQIMQTQIDKAVVQMAMRAIEAAGGDSTNANIVREVLMVFINKGIPLTTAFDIMMDIAKITSKMQGGEEKWLKE